MGRKHDDCQMPMRPERFVKSAACSETEHQAPPSSPACSMQEADDVYMGYADQAEVTAFLKERLEAECVGAQVARQAAREAKDQQILDLLRETQHDLAVSCALLSHQILLSHHISTRRTASSSPAREFYEKALASGDARCRLVFLNCGQMVAFRELQAMWHRIRDDALHAVPTDILRLTETRVRRVDTILNLMAG